MDAERIHPAAKPYRPTALWAIVVLLAVIATALVMDGKDGVAMAQAGPVGARGIFMLPAQLAPNAYGVVMMDVDTGTLWCYEYVASKQQLRLAAARSWIFDRYLEEYNVMDLTSADVEKLVEDVRLQKLRSSGGLPGPTGR